MLDALRRGDRVVTGGGIIGTVSQGGRATTRSMVDIADGVRVRVLRSTITSVLAKPEPVAAKEREASRRRGQRATAGAPTPAKDAKRRREPGRDETARNRGGTRTRSDALFPPLEGAADLRRLPARRAVQRCRTCSRRRQLDALAELRAAQAGQPRPRSARRLVSAARGRHAAAQTRAAQLVVDSVRTALRDAKIGYTGLDVEGDAIVFTLRDPDRIEDVARQRSPRSIPASTVDDRPDGAGTMQFSARSHRGSAAARRSSSRSRSSAAASTRPAPRSRPSSARARTASWSSCPASTIPSTSRRCSARPRR